MTGTASSGTSGSVEVYVGDGHSGAGGSIKLTAGDFVPPSATIGNKGGDVALESGYSLWGESGAVSLATANAAGAASSSGAISIGTGKAFSGGGGAIALAVGDGVSAP